MLILAENGPGLPFDYDELERWTRVGFRVVAPLSPMPDRECGRRYSGLLRLRQLGVE
jgi:hypothetical protein